MYRILDFYKEIIVTGGFKTKKLANDKIEELIEEKKKELQGYDYIVVEDEYLELLAISKENLELKEQIKKLQQICLLCPVKIGTKVILNDSGKEAEITHCSWDSDNEVFLYVNNIEQTYVKRDTFTIKA